MSTPRSWGKIEFPVRLIDDEIRKHLESNYEAEFNEDGTLKDWHGADIEPGQIDGIFSIEDGEAAYGEFDELEALLIEKGIPFDRESGMDWNRKPVRLVYRPAQGDKASMELNIDLDDDGDEVVSVKAIREILKGKPDETEKDVGLLAYQKTIDLMTYLDEYFPAYPPLTAWVKED